MMYGVLRPAVVLVLVFALTDHAAAQDSQSMPDEKRLIEHLIGTYERVGLTGRPVFNTSETLRVNYGLALIQIMDLDERNQVLTTNVWERYLWHDRFLKWNPDEYGGVDHVRIPADKIWKPDLVVYNYADERLTVRRDAMAVVSSNGAVLWIPMAIFKTTCSIDVTDFPYDEQTCDIKIGSWTYDGFKLDIDFYNGLEAIDVTDYIPSNEWEVTGHPARKNVKYYACCIEPYPDLTFSLHLKRQSVFYTNVLVTPCLLLTLLTVLIFWLPPNSIAKIFLGLFIFASCSWLLFMLAGIMPPTSAAVPLLGKHISLVMIFATKSMFLSAIVIGLHVSGDSSCKVPTWLKKVVIDGLGRIMCMREGTGNGDDKQAESAYYQNIKDLKSNAVDTGMSEEQQNLKAILARLEERDATGKAASEWHLVARILNRLFFFVYLVIIIILLIAVFPKG